MECTEYMLDERAMCTGVLRVHVLCSKWIQNLAYPNQL